MHEVLVYDHGQESKFYFPDVGYPNADDEVNFSDFFSQIPCGSNKHLSVCHFIVPLCMYIMCHHCLIPW